MEKFLEIGKIIGAKGLKGEVSIEPWCDAPEFFKKFKHLYLDKGKICLKIISVRVIKSSVAIFFDGINNIDKAQNLRGEILYMDRNDIKLEKGRYFIADLIGLKVYDESSGKLYGSITQVFKTGANDVYQITDENNKNYLVPVIPDVVKNIDMDFQRVTIKPIKGIFDDED